MLGSILSLMELTCFGFELGDFDGFDHFADENSVAIFFESVVEGAQVGSGYDVVQVQRVAGIEGDGVWASFGSGPKGGAGGCDLVFGEIVQQLLDRVGKKLFET